MGGGSSSGATPFSSYLCGRGILRRRATTRPASKASSRSAGAQPTRRASASPRVEERLAAAYDAERRRRRACVHSTRRSSSFHARSNRRRGASWPTPHFYPDLAQGRSLEQPPPHQIEDGSRIDARPPRRVGRLGSATFHARRRRLPWRGAHPIGRQRGDGPRPRQGRGAEDWGHRAARRDARRLSASKRCSRRHVRCLAARSLPRR